MDLLNPTLADGLWPWRQHLSQAAMVMSTLVPRQAITAAKELAREMGIPRSRLLGVFIGVPKIRRQPSFELPSLPERIELYQENIERVAGTPEEVKHQVRLTLRHEIGHYFGLTERELRELEG